MDFVGAPATVDLARAVASTGSDIAIIGLGSGALRDIAIIGLGSVALPVGFGILPLETRVSVIFGAPRRSWPKSLPWRKRDGLPHASNGTV
jgi:hypothetical protein